MTYAATDIQHDSTGRLEAWVRTGFKVPEWAEGFDKQASPGLPKAAYAWPEARLFPVDTRQNTWWSSVAAARLNTAEDIDRPSVEKIASNLKKALAFWNIDDGSFQPLEQDDGAGKEASRVFTLSLSVNGAPVDTVSCSDSGEFVKTARWLNTRGRRMYPYECRRDAAREMLADKYAEALEFKDRVELEKTAGYGAVSRARMTCMLDILSKGLDKLGYQEFQGMLDNVADTCPEISTGSDLDKTASLIDGVHRALRAANKAEGVNVPPLEEMLNIQTPTMLQKAGESFVVFPDGRFIDDEEFEKHAGTILEYVNTVLCKEATMDSLRDVVEGLDGEESAEFTEALAALGI